MNMQDATAGAPGGRPLCHPPTRRGWLAKATRSSAAAVLAAHATWAGTARADKRVCEIRLTNRAVYRSVTLEARQIRLETRYGVLVIPVMDLVRLVCSAGEGQDVAATLAFTARGDLLLDEIAGRMPAGTFSLPVDAVREVVFGLPATLAARQEQATHRILWFRDRNNDMESLRRSGFFGYAEVARMAEELGAVNVEMTDEVTLTDAMLSEYDAVVFMNVGTGRALDADEQRSLRDYLASGRRILVIGQQDLNSALSQEALFANSVTLPYGIEFTQGDEESRAPTSRLAAHDLTEGVKEVPGGGSLLEVAAPAEVLAPAGGPRGLLAVSSHGNGRIVAVSDDATFADLSLTRGDRRSADRRRFVDNVLWWLLTPPPQPEPPRGTVPE